MSSPFNLSRKYNTIAAIIAGAVIGTVIISFFLIRPAWHSLRQLGHEVPQAQQQRDSAKAELSGLENAQSYFKDNQDTVDEVNIAVPLDPQVPQILLVLEELAKDNKVRLTSFTPQQATAASAQSGQAGGASKGASPTAAVAGSDTIEVAANFEGSYSSLISFFYTLERSLRIIDVKSITVNGGSQSTTNQAMTGSITFTAYYKKTTPTATTPDATQGAAGAK
jgi:Tfp pilus assembly protein PilO